MKDRTLIILAVIFLTFSISGGVNKSLEAGNRTMGKPMAPDLKQLYYRYVPSVTNKLQEFKNIKVKAEQQLNAGYPEVVTKLNELKEGWSEGIKNQTQEWRIKLMGTYNNFRDKDADKKINLL